MTPRRDKRFDALNAVIVCRGFDSLRVLLQPWRYAYELCQYLVGKSAAVTVLSDRRRGLAEMERISGITVHRLESVISVVFYLRSQRIIARTSPDVVVIMSGVTSLLWIYFMRLRQPFILILMSPLYSIREVFRAGFWEFIVRWDYMLIHLFDALIPNFFIRRFMNRRPARIVVLSRSNYNRLMRMGVLTSKVVLIPPGLEAVETKNRLTDRAGGPEIVYFGSPSFLRGTDVLVKAFEIVKKELPSARLTLLLRPDDRRAIRQVPQIRSLCRKLKLTDAVRITLRFLSRHELYEHLCRASVVALPFKLVPSDMPLGPYEAMATGTPLVTTAVDSLPELVGRDRGLLVPPNNSESLARAILTLATEKVLAAKVASRAVEFITMHPSWTEVGERFLKVLSQGMAKNAGECWKSEVEISRDTNAFSLGKSSE